MTALKKMAALLAVAAFVVLSVSACNLFVSDEQVISNMITTMAGVESYSNETSVLGTLAVDEVPSLEFNITMDGNAFAAKVSEENEITKAAFEYNLDGGFNVQGQEMSFNADMKFVDEGMYFKINTLPMIPTVDLSEGMNKWIFLDFSLLDEFNTVKTGTVSETNLADLMTYANGLYSEANIFVLKDDLGSEKVNGHSVYHYLVDINKEAMANMMMDLVMKMVDTEGIDDTAIETTKTEMMEAFETLNFKNLELFIDKDDFYLRRIIMELEIAAPEDAMGSVNIKFDGIYDDFNKKIEILVPEEFINAEDLMAPMILELDDENSFSIDDMGEVNLDDLSEEDKEILNQFLEENPQIELEY